MLRPEIEVGRLYINMNPRARTRDWVKEGGAAPLFSLRPLDLHIATSTYAYRRVTARCLQRHCTPFLGRYRRVTADIYVYREGAPPTYLGGTPHPPGVD